MKKTILFVGMVFLAMPLFCEVVKSDVLTSKYGVSYAERQMSNYIQKGGYSFQYLGNGTWDVKPLIQTGISATSDSSNNGLVVIFLLIVGIIIVIGVCVSNITTAVAKNSGMDEESAKKVGKSAGVLAGTAAAIGAAILLGKAGKIKPDDNHITITHRHR